MTAVRDPGVIGRPRLLLPTTSFAEHRARYGAPPRVGWRALAEAVAAAGLTGRGGAGFPSARKLEAVATRGPGTVVANAAEGEPASAKDRVLLRISPHLVLDGLVLAARAVGANRVYLYAPADVLHGPVAAALAERDDDIAVRVVEAPDRFVAGQESAAVAAVEGRPARPRDTPPAVWESGVHGRPTLVQNVETLAHIALIAAFGPEWFRTVGAPDEPGSRLVTVSGAVVAPGVYELAGGTRLSRVLAAAGGVSEPVHAVLVGGYHGGWVRTHDATGRLTDPRLSRADLHPFGATPGAGVVVALPAHECGLRATASIAHHLADQSAGQCGPCRHGLPAVAVQFGELAAGRVGPHAVRDLRRLADLVDGRGACAHPDGTARMLRSALRAFADDVDAHLDGWCTAVRR